MHIVLGRQPPTNVPLAWDPSTLINPHIVVAGDSGSGKTANLRHWCEQLVAQGAGTGLERIHVFDSHGDIDVPASLVEFSQSTPYAYNPLGARRLALDLAYIQRIRPYELALVNLKRRGLVPEWLPLALPRLGPALGKPVRLAA